MAKAGRKRKTVKRQPNGQPYRPPADPREVVIGARLRQFGYSKEKATHPWAGYELGRMVLAGLFGPPQENDAHRAIAAAEQYVQIVADYMRHKCPGQPMPKAMDYLAGRGTSLTPDPSRSYVNRIVERYEAETKKLAQAGGIARMVFHDVVFHDRKCAPDRIEAVETCVRLLMGR